VIARLRAHALDAAIIAVLLVMAAAPVRDRLGPDPSRGLTTAAAVRVAWEEANRRALKGGDVPAWNPYQLGGRPHLANPDTLVLYPPHLPLRLLPVDVMLSVSFALHAWLAGLGAYLIARHVSMGPVPAGLGAGGVMIAVVLSQGSDFVLGEGVYSLAWLPLIVLFAIRSTERGTRLPHPGLVVTVLCAMTGSARGPVYALSAVASVYLLWAPVNPQARAARTRLVVQGALALLLGAGLSAFQTVPMARLWLSASRHQGLTRDTVAPGSRHFSGIKTPEPDVDVRRALAGLTQGGRVVTACDEVLDATQLMSLGTPGVDGQGGVVPQYYARFAYLAGGGDPKEARSFGGFGAAATDRARGDLLQFLHAEYLVACSEPDPLQWVRVAEAGAADVYRSTRQLPRAFWTCAPQAIGRQALEYRLWRAVYDDRLALRTNGRTNWARGPSIAIRWSPAADDGARAQAEAELGLHVERARGDRTWQYELPDGARETVSAIVNHPLVEDTAGLDRGSLALLPPAVPDLVTIEGEPASEWAIGLEPCDQITPATVLRADRFDGGMTVAVDAPRDGIVFLSETFYPWRQAWVDGTRIQPLKVNLAFTGVPVTAGIHRIELQYDPLAFPVGVALTMTTAIAWSLAAFRRSVRRPAEAVTT
jgi:hypothetical protein